MKNNLLVVIALVTLTLVAVGPSEADASPWTKSQGEYYFKLGHTYYSASGHRTPSGEVIDSDHYSLTTFLYGEVGLWDDLHARFYLPLGYARTTYDNDTYGSYFGFQDSEWSLQYSPLDLGFPTAVRAEVKLPLYGYQFENPPVPARGDHQIDYTLWVSAGGSLHTRDIPLYYSLDMGYRWRTSTTPGSSIDFDDFQFSDAVVGFAQMGYTLGGRLDMGINSSAIIPVDRGDFDESFITVGPALFAPVNDRLALEADAYTMPFVRNTGQGWAVTAGISLRRDTY